jgi:hypothetical protein
MTQLERTQADERGPGRRGYAGNITARARRLLPGVLIALLVGAGYASTSFAANGEPSLAPTKDLLWAAFAAAFALAWAMGCAWLGMRRVRTTTRLDKSEDDWPGTVLYSLQPLTCERMHDETRLVPQYLRSAKFPAMKQDLVRLAREHIDEGQALRRLQRVPDRCYGNLHDLITEIRVD